MLSYVSFQIRPLTELEDSRKCAVVNFKNVTEGNDIGMYQVFVNLVLANGMLHIALLLHLTPLTIQLVNLACGILHTLNIESLHIQNSFQFCL